MEEETNFSLICLDNEAADLLMTRDPETDWVVVKHAYKIKKLMEINYRECEKLTFFKFMSENVCVDPRHSENIPLKKNLICKDATWYRRSAANLKENEPHE